MDYIERMERELKELVKDGNKLDKKIVELEGKGLTSDEMGLMYAQLYAMNLYADILDKRIGLARALHR